MAEHRGFRLCLKKADLPNPLCLQVFDKALSEPTFCEIYATLCHDLKALPEFPPPAESDDKKTINFRRSLVNKCQEEFMAGVQAMEAVKSRENADAQKDSKVFPGAPITMGLYTGCQDELNNEDIYAVQNLPQILH